jgi:S-phase kinase-associated protein 1
MNVRLITSNNETFDVPIDIIKISKLVKSLLDIDIDIDIDDIQEIPLPNINSNILTKIIEFLKYYNTNPLKEIEKPLKSNNITDIVSDKWYADYINIDNEIVFDITIAANYMDIQPLLDLGCAFIAASIKGKTAEELKTTFGIEGDIGRIDEEKLREENKWCEEN